MHHSTKNSAVASVALGLASLTLPACSERASLSDVTSNVSYTEKNFVPFSQIEGDPFSYVGARTRLPNETTGGIVEKDTRLYYRGSHTDNHTGDNIYDYEFVLNHGNMYEKTYVVISDSSGLSSRNISAVLCATENGKIYFDARESSVDGI